VLNGGQAVIFTLALTLCMVMAVNDIAAGDKTVGHFVMVNALMLQLFIPLNFMGMVYREIKQSLIDIERMLDVLAIPPEVSDRADARALEVKAGTIRFENVKFAYEPERTILEGCPSRCRPEKCWRSWGHRAPVSRPFPAFSCAFTMSPAAASRSTVTTSATSPRHRCAPDWRGAAGYRAVQ
jgi:hypothetical protein